eukprot:1147806-Pelagomonas_calceolata.AAC.1
MQSVYPHRDCINDFREGGRVREAQTFPVTESPQIAKKRTPCFPTWMNLPACSSTRATGQEFP